jgi:hypothetical protein
VDTAVARLWMTATHGPQSEALAEPPAPSTASDGIDLRGGRPADVRAEVWDWARSAVEWGDRPKFWEVGEEIDVVVALAPRRTVPARLVEIDRLMFTDRKFKARSLDGRTSYEGWVSTFHYSTLLEGSPLCDAATVARSETILYATRERPVL